MFASSNSIRLKEATINTMKEHQAKGDTIFVISASIENWVKPFCQKLGVKNVLCTQIETSASKKVTGHFLTPNCYGKEKVTRLLQIESDRERYHLTAYGDSRGDREILDFADESHLID